MKFIAAIGAALCAAAFSVGAAQEPQNTPKPANAADGLEPAVQTSSSAAVKQVAPATAARPPAASTPRSGTGRNDSKATTKAPERLELNASQITGNRELPRVMYVVPWRKADLGDFAGRPPNSLLDEALAPVDRDVFRRQNRYYAALNSAAAAPGSQDRPADASAPTPAAKDEK